MIFRHKPDARGYIWTHYFVSCPHCDGKGATVARTGRVNRQEPTVAGKVCEFCEKGLIEVYKLKGRRGSKPDAPKN